MMQSTRSPLRFNRTLILSTALAGGLFVLSAPAAAQATGAGIIIDTVANGAGATNVNTSVPNTTTITVGNSRTIINWDSLNVANGQNLNFVVANSTDAVLNRVLGGSTTTINGNLNSYVGSVGATTGGQIFILNSNGVVFGANARVNVGGLVAGTLGLTDGDFLDGNSGFDFSGSGDAPLSVVSGANLSAVNGPLVFVAGSINSAGAINASGDVGFVTGSNITASIAAGSPLSLSIASGSVINGGIVASGTIAGRNVYVATVNRTGVTNAVLNVSSSITATGATASDRGIVLTAGSSASGVTIVDSPDTAGPSRLLISGVLDSAKNIEIGSRSDIAAASAMLDAEEDVAGFAQTMILGTVRSGNDINLFAGQIGAGSQDLSLQAGRNITLSGPAVGRDIAIRAGGVVLAGTLTGRDDIVVRAGGQVFTGPVASGTSVDALGGTEVSGAADSLASATLVGSDVDVEGQFLEIGAAIAVGQNSDIRLDGADVLLGDATSGGLINLNASGAISIAGVSNSGSNPLTATAGNGSLTIEASGRLIGSEVILSTGSAFINARGSDAISASNRWLVYSVAPSGNTFGGLNSANTAVWNGTLATAAPGTLTGNRYIFAFQPTITATSTNTSKVYGTDLTGALNGFVTVSGLQQGISGVYLGDTLADVLSGAAAITSLGAVANADVAGGPYVMTVNQGTLVTSRGYGLTLNSAGRLTITPKAITGSVIANNKTYDGNRTGTGTVTLDGVVSGDVVGTTGTTFTFSDKNAGTGKTVAVASTTLTGADAGNYTLTVPASALADILAKAITASVAVGNKTYDGNRTGTGTVALDGVVSGDVVGTTGTTFTFSDKNAGTGKTVAVASTTLTGADAGNYTLTVPASALADILAKAITASVAVGNKTYDGNRTGTGTVALDGVVSGDVVGTTGTTFTFSDKNAGTGKTVAIAGTTLTGADAGNYTLTVPASALADILAKAITASVAVGNKTYDGNRTGTGTVALDGVVSGDVVGTTGTTFTFSDKNAGTGKTVAIAGTTLTGADAGNYTLTVPASALADILAKAITASVAVGNKTYDGNRTGTGTVALDGVVSGDVVGTTGTTFTFSDKNAGTGKTVAVASTTLTGADAGNYTLTVPASALADILARLLVITADDKNKPQGTPDPALTFEIGGDGLAAGDTLSGALVREPGEILGEYAITQGTLDAGSNYTLRFEGGTLTIIAPPFRQVPLRSQTLPGDILAPFVRGGLTIDASGVCTQQQEAACQATQ